MKDTSRMKFVSETDVDSKRIGIRRPLKIDHDEQRQFVRLGISSPMSLTMIKDILGDFWSSGRDYDIDGTILNISAGGVLVELEQPLNEGDIVAMRFSLEEVESLEGVLGLVKRCEQDEDCYLTGIEFVTRQNLGDKLSQSEMELLSDNFSHFDRTVQKVLSRYIYEHDRIDS
ncbi:MAG: PilZ domain-containing protein [candidate division Zixibacteria bacterium]|nr:PilZ domain-containing protein [candidate division Zixibacteria bacterium]